ncbi:hypothetical protein P7C71_g6224, partial [Lecanoromycetidae sp. Uapishka_2]
MTYETKNGGQAELCVRVTMLRYMGYEAFAREKAEAFARQKEADKREQTVKKIVWADIDDDDDDGEWSRTPIQWKVPLPAPDAAVSSNQICVNRAESCAIDTCNESTETRPSEHHNTLLLKYSPRLEYPHPSTRTPYHSTPLRMSTIYNVQEQETADTPAEQIAVDGSAGSDTDTGGPLKTDAAIKDESDIPHHARSNSVKKLTTFKAVSVTKNFLAKAGTPTAPAAKANGDTVPSTPTGGAAMPPAPRPRLVAKTASGNKPSAPKSSHFNSKHGASGPDPMQVWNRNRGKHLSVAHQWVTVDGSAAAPQPTPKQFTDEELKQHYGIHLATRLQADGEAKEKNWADIDDDEDDWAPETIEWNDGTKITLAQNDSAVLLAEEQARELVEKDRQDAEEKVRKAAQHKPTTTVGPNATVLKPRSAAQTKSVGLVLKTPSEKPTLVAKPAAPAPVRSPWASLPPVEKVPPVDINPPNQTATLRPQHNDSHSNQSMPPPPQQAAMEIAADDFTRTRRDTQNGNLGQLYNAQSGQYEPANTGRRGSVRKDQNFRPPTLLQRGSQYDQHGAAEPSAAFQTQRSGSQQDAGPWSRRRSSTVSGESGHHDRRMSVTKSSDVQSPLPPSARESPAVQHSQLSEVAHGASPYQSRNDDVVAQKQLMKEKRELAIKRKREEEEREEAAKKERIRIKMEQMGLAPLEEKKLDDKKPLEKPESVVSQLETKADDKPAITTENALPPAQLQPSPAAVALSPPKPPMPDPSGAPQQYGMMRVHGPNPDHALQPSSDRSTTEKTRNQGPGQRISPPGIEHPIEPLPSPKVNGLVASKHPDAPVYRPGDVANQRELRQQPWNNASRDSNGFGNWNGQGMTRDTSASSSVWGPPTHTRNIGNGTFDRNVRSQSRPQDQFASPALAPIGPPRHLQRPRDGQELRANEVAASPVVEDFQTIPTFPATEASTPSMLRVEPPATLANADKKTSPQFGASAQLPTQTNNVQRPVQGQDNRSTVAAWGNFQATDAEANRQRAQQHALKLEEEARLGIRRPEPQLPVMNETWRQVKVDEEGGQRQIVGVQKGQNSHDRLAGAQVNGDLRSSTFGTPSGMPPFAAAGMGRGSRFFPGAGTGMYPQYQNTTRLPSAYRRSSSPPPPEDELHFHPAYAREYRYPRVNLPPVKNTPKVRLPPSIPAPVQSPQVAEVRTIPFRAASQPLVNNPTWQDRFNGLLGNIKKASPEKKYAQVTEFSATKVPLDSPSVQAMASVTLPPQNATAANKTLEVASKAFEDEEALFENREFGSLPAVLIPTQTPEVGWLDAKIPRKGQAKQSKQAKEVESASKESFIEKDIIANGGVMIFIKMLGMMVPKSVTLPRPNSQYSQGPVRPRPFSGHSKPNKGFKPRETAGNYPNDLKSSQGGHQRNALPNGPPQGRGQPGKNHSPWGQRPTNIVH